MTLRDFVKYAIINISSLNVSKKLIIPFHFVFMQIITLAKIINIRSNEVLERFKLEIQIKYT